MTQNPSPTDESARGSADERVYTFRLPSLERVLQSFLPPEAVTHLRAARREQLLAARAMVDAAIERLDATDRSEARTVSRRVNIEVE